jgi:carbamate kinase
MRILAALDGNAWLHRGGAAEAAVQQHDVEMAADALAEILSENEVIITLDNCSHMLEASLRNTLPDRNLITVLTEVVVSADDPAFRAPSKSIGPVYSQEEARRLIAERRWFMGRDGEGFRRLVPSPEPHAIAELPSLRILIDAGVLVICAGGGGIPITVDGAGAMRSVEAVVDKDLTAALLARRLDVDLLLLLTDVDAVHLGGGSDADCALHSVSPAELRGMRFTSGSMASKAEAACRFVEATGRRAAVGALSYAVAIARGEAGTQVSSRGVSQASA